MLAKVGPIVTEPLELECLSAIAGRIGYECHIHDPFVDKQPLQAKMRQYRPGVVAVSGYYPARRELFGIMEAIKSEYPEVVIFAGGADIEICCEDYFTCHADVLIHSGGFTTFRKTLEHLRQGNDLKTLDGICYRSGSGRFIRNQKAAMDPTDIPEPDRKHFYRYRSFYHYIGYGETALVKGSYGCPHACSFCSARLLNQGTYQARAMDDILDEIEQVDAETIWLVDDIFLPDEKRALDFITKVEKRGLQKKFILYSRADIICQHAHLMARLKKVGVVNVIAGLEAVDDTELSAYCKGYTADVNKACAGILAQNNIGLTALFIADLDADHKYFFRLFKWILKNRIKMFTVSIYTPLPGTRDFDRYRSLLTTTDPSKWDFLHLVVKPRKLGVLSYYAWFWGIHLTQVLINPGQLKSYIRHQIKKKKRQRSKDHASG